MDDSALARVESQRIELETNIAKLRKALRHWQTLEIDYESLREEFLGIPQDSAPEECLQAAKDCKPELLNEKEIQQLLVDTSSRPRRPAQLVDMLSKRVDYVTRNVETIRKQLSEAEKKRNALLLAEEPDHRDEASLPLAEILEELDESGKIISSRVQTPGSDAPQLLDALKKAGVEDLEETNGTITKATSPSKAVDHDNANSENEEVEVSPQPQSTINVALGRNTSTSTGQLPINSSDTPKEAELRREMLEYSRGLEEVGAIVAELELEEETSDVSYDQDRVDETDSELDIAEDFEDDSEDETGKSRLGLSLSRGYQKKMEELQERLGLKNVGPGLDTEATIDRGRKEPRPPAAEAARKAAIARNEKSKKSSLKTAITESSKSVESIEKKPSKKKVAFTSELDIAAEEPLATTPAPTKQSLRVTEKPQLRPFHESIVEREADWDGIEPSAPSVPVLPKAAKHSHFRATRQSQPQTPMFAQPMEFPPEKTADENPTSQPLVSKNLVERPSLKTTKAPDPNDFSDQDHQREIARDYEQHRVKRILAQEGRFLANAEEGEITPLQDEETGRRVSRFKAAKLKR